MINYGIIVVIFYVLSSREWGMIMDNAKAEAYLYDRLDMLSDEKVSLVTKLNKIQIEIEEIDIKIAQMSEDVDTAFEVFSPRPKKNDFVKIEIDKLTKRKEELKELFSDFSEQLVSIDEDIDVIREALGEAPEDGEEIYIRGETKDNIDEQMYGIKILEQQENERGRIARDLHDSVVQVLTSLVHKSEICMKIVDVDAIRAKLELEIMSKTIRETIEEMRNIIYDLRPMSFDDLGLDVTLERIIKKIDSETEMNVSLKIEGEPKELQKVVQITLFRIVQECVSNSIKYSDGKNLNIRLMYYDDIVYLEIADDGKGIENLHNPEIGNSDSHTGLGLNMMRERVSLLSGDIEIKTQVGEGTAIKIRIPI